MESVTTIDIHSENDLADRELCGKVSDILNRHYPNHLWMVGCDHKSGMVYVELPYETARRAFPFGFSLHIGKLGNAKSMQKKVMRAGGELLERFNLERGIASRDTLSLAKENGLDSSNKVA